MCVFLLENRAWGKECPRSPDRTSDLSVTLARGPLPEAPLDSTRLSHAGEGVLTGTAPSPWTWVWVAHWTGSPQWGPKADWLQL